MYLHSFLLQSCGYIMRAWRSCSYKQKLCQGHTAGSQIIPGLKSSTLQWVCQGMSAHSTHTQGLASITHPPVFSLPLPFSLRSVEYTNNAYASGIFWVCACTCVCVFFSKALSVSCLRVCFCKPLFLWVCERSVFLNDVTTPYFASHFQMGTPFATWCWYFCRKIIRYS